MPVTGNSSVREGPPVRVLPVEDSPSDRELTDESMTPRDIVRHRPSPVRRLTAIYGVALSAVALLCVTGNVLVQRALHQQEGDARVINVAGRQRMLSQALTKVDRKSVV